MPPSKFMLAKAQIKAAFGSLEGDIFKRTDISNVLAQHREEWALPKNTTGSLFAKKLIEAKILHAFSFPFPTRKEVRYAKPHVPMLNVLQSLKANSYFTHATAMAVHRLVDEPSKDIYINFEQPDHVRAGLPEQTRIDTAFKNNPRKTNNIIHQEAGDIIMLNGMYTGLLGIEERLVKGVDKKTAKLRLTDLERTLIDITVRPYYGHEVQGVLAAYQLARAHVDGAKLAAYLRQLNYVYPYHQAVGWYMTKAGYSEQQMQGIKSQPILRRFYLTHKMSVSSFDHHWQIYIPSCIERET